MRKFKIFMSMLVVAAVVSLPMLAGVVSASSGASFTDNSGEAAVVGEKVTFNGSGTTINGQGLNVTVETSETVELRYTETADGLLRTELVQNTNNTTSVTAKTTETDGDTFNYTFSGVGDSFTVKEDRLSSLEFIDDAEGATVFKADISGGDEFGDVSSYSGTGYKYVNSIDSGVSVNVVGYDWQMGDGTTLAGESVTHTYANAGDYTVQVTATDAHGETHTVSQLVSVNSIETEFSLFSDFTVSSVEELQQKGGGNLEAFVTVTDSNGTQYSGTLARASQPANSTYYVGEPYSDGAIVLDDENNTVVQLDSFTVTSATDRLSGEEVMQFPHYQYAQLEELRTQADALTAATGGSVSDGGSSVPLGVLAGGIGIVTLLLIVRD